MGTRRGKPVMYLHVGLPKTGTTTLQSRFVDSRPALALTGFQYPFVRGDGMFHAAVELLGWHEHWGLKPKDIDGTWARFCERARHFDGPTLVSHEIFGRLQPHHVARAMEETHGIEVHVIVTARDLARQVPAVWQERVKNGHTWNLGTFIDREKIIARDQKEKERSPFWREQGLLRAMRHWRGGVPEERVHLVTCPPRGADPEELVRRFCGVMGLDPARLVAPTQMENPSLGAPEIEILRRVNRMLDKDVPRFDYSHVIKRFFAQQTLARPDTRRVLAPARLRPRLTRVTERWIDEIDAGDWQVHGDLEELLPVDFDESGEPADRWTDEELAEIGPEVMVALLEEIVHVRRELAGMHHESLRSRIRHTAARGRDRLLG